MRKILQRVLLGVGVIALIILLVDIAISIIATIPGTTPVKVVHVQAGPYPLTVNLYKYPANAGYALPFSIVSTQALTYKVQSNPDFGAGATVKATAVKAALSTDANSPDTTQGTAEITVRGNWGLNIVADGPQGQGVAVVPIQAVAPSAIPLWLGWLVGIIPLVCLIAFLLLQRRPEVQDAQNREMEPLLKA
jgi:hypothetical protein